MKKVLTMVTTIILATSLSAFAGNSKPINQQSSYELSFTRLQVEDGIDLVLVEGPGKTIEFKGADSDVDKVDWKIQNGVMRISSKKGSLKGKVKLIINVSDLTDLYVKDGSEVSSYGRLHSAFLKIYLDGDSFVSIQSTGDIRIVKLDDTEMEVRRAVGNVTF